MSQRSGYDPGVPCWVDLSSTDVAGSARFYGAIFGWEADMIDDPAAGGYGMFTYQGKKVAGLGPVMGEGMPSSWNTFVATDDAAALAGRVRDAGGTVTMEPMAVFDEGTMTVFRAPDGSFTGAWQAGNHRGAERAGANVLVRAMDAPPGAFSMLTDPQGAAFSIIQLHETG